jgi:hypothetical protein
MLKPLLRHWQPQHWPAFRRPAAEAEAGEERVGGGVGGREGRASCTPGRARRPGAGGERGESSSS